MSRFLVTGGAGFIGSGTVDRLVALGHEVRVIDNLSSGSLDNIAAVINKVDFMRGDLSDFNTAQEAVCGIEYIIHMAALPSVFRSVRDPVKCNESIVTASVNLFKAAVDAKSVRRVVQAASASAYGNDPVLPKREDMIPAPISPYAAAKLAQEYYGRVFYNTYGLEVASLRYFNVYGPRQDRNSVYSAVIPKFVSAMLGGERPVIFGDGLTSRDFVYIDDVVDANILSCYAEWDKMYETFNIGSGESITLNNLVDIVNGILGTHITPKYEQFKADDVLHSRADIRRAKHILNFNPKVGIEEGLKRFVECVKCK